MKFAKMMKKSFSRVSKIVNPSNWSPRATMLIVVALVVGLIVMSSVMIVSGYEPNYKRMADELNVVQMYDSEDLSDNIMVDSHKNGTVIIERKFAKCINADKGLGVDIYTEEDVDLSGVDNLTKGAIVAVYYIYNPDAMGEEALIAEFSYVLDR